MPEFQLNCGRTIGPKRWARWDPFTRAYVEAMFWTEGADRGVEQRDCENDPAELGGCSLDDLSDDAFQVITEDCEGFQRTYTALLEGCDPSQAGYDYWLTRNGHGTGFWDHLDPATYPGDPGGGKLTEAAHAAGEQYAYLGDDGRIYVS